MTVEAMRRLTQTARISLKPRTGCFVAFVTIIHHFGQANQLVRSTLWTRDDMQVLADTGVRMPDWYKKPLKIAIVGSRNFTDTQAIVDYVNSLPENTVIVSGGARGVDSIAEQAAKARGLETVIFSAEWSKYGKSAGFRRNADIVNACTRLVAFWDGKSRGTNHSIGIARKQGKQGKQVDINPAIKKPAIDLKRYFDMRTPDAEAAKMLEMFV